ARTLGGGAAAERGPPDPGGAVEPVGQPVRVALDAVAPGPAVAVSGKRDGRGVDPAQLAGDRDPDLRAAPGAVQQDEAPHPPSGQRPSSVQRPSCCSTSSWTSSARAFSGRCGSRQSSMVTVTLSPS